MLFKFSSRKRKSRERVRIKLSQLWGDIAQYFCQSHIFDFTDHSSVSRLHLGRRRPQRKRRPRQQQPPMSRTSSFSSITDSTMSLNIITVTLNMDTVNFLGISIVGQSNKGGDGGIYVGSIMKGWVSTKFVAHFIWDWFVLI